MKCFCVLDGFFSFKSEFMSCGSLLFKDTSKWLEKPDNYLVKLYFPNNPIPKEYIIDVKSFTIIEESFPTGIYTVEATICDKTYKKQFLNICKLECALSNMLANLSFCEQDGEKIKEAKKYKLWIDSLKAKFNCEIIDIKEIKEIVSYLKDKLGECAC